MAGKTEVALAASEQSGLAASNELIRWLRLLALPVWARAAILLLVVIVVVGGTALLPGKAGADSAEQAAFRHVFLARGVVEAQRHAMLAP